MDVEVNAQTDYNPDSTNKTFNIIGAQNVRQNSFMNSFIQTFIHTNPMINLFQSNL